jgi:hypothetical protein
MIYRQGAASSALASVVVLVWVTGMAAAQNVTALTLSCVGTATNALVNKVEKVRVGVIVDFGINKVIGFGPGWESVIDSVDDTSVDFHRFSGNSDLRSSVEGSIDRITGALIALVEVASEQNTITNVSYDLLCKPARRLF